MGWGGGGRRQSNAASTCYAAGSMPLAFTQEDFLGDIIFNETIGDYLKFDI